jgi:hypothetical protein
MLDGRQITALVLDDGARLAHQPGLAGGARLADIGVNAKDRAHRGLLYINNAAAPNRQRGGILEARSPRLSEVAQHMPGTPTANYKAIQWFIWLYN